MSKSYSVIDIIDKLAKRENRDISSSFIYKNTRDKDVCIGKEKQDEEEKKDDDDTPSNVVVTQELKRVQTQRDKNDDIPSSDTAREDDDDDHTLSRDNEHRDTCVGIVHDDERRECNEDDGRNENVKVIDLQKATNITNTNTITVTNTKIDDNDTTNLHDQDALKTERRLYFINSLKRVLARRKNKPPSTFPIHRQKEKDDVTYISAEDFAINNTKEKERTDCHKCLFHVFNRLVDCFELLIKLKTRSSVL
uniref:Uncharacterized protein n=1 Tax=Penaeus semisulcatus majanivirus TaxID=2984274 RepID=A0A9C7BVQ2_9VIRU|nr:MAG: hypothetical protein [Penaeus semisulcatus majanivirus]